MNNFASRGSFNVIYVTPKRRTYKVMKSGPKPGTLIVGKRHTTLKDITTPAKLPPEIFSKIIRLVLDDIIPPDVGLTANGLRETHPSYHQQPDLRRRNQSITLKSYLHPKAKDTMRAIRNVARMNVEACYVVRRTLPGVIQTPKERRQVLETYRSSQDRYGYAYWSDGLMIEDLNEFEAPMMHFLRRLRRFARKGIGRKLAKNEGKMPFKRIPKLSDWWAKCADRVVDEDVAASGTSCENTAAGKSKAEHTNSGVEGGEANKVLGDGHEALP